MLEELITATYNNTIMTNEALITQVASLSSHDGPGMRTTVFFKGCSLRCSWCHNPETINRRVDIEWDSNKCIACHNCVDVCKSMAIDFTGDNFYPIDKDKCKTCQKCVDVCPSKSLTAVGMPYSVESLYNRLIKDEVLNKAMDGGVTFSGGEPALQSVFISELSGLLKLRDVHIAFDTCGSTERSNFDTLLPLIDLLLYDIKEFDPCRHKSFTGVVNNVVLNNILYISDQIRAKQLPVTIWIRTPLIPGMTATDENIAAIGNFISENLSDLVDKWELCSFNNLCVDKYRRLGMKWSLCNEELLSDEQLFALLSVAKRMAPQINVTASGLTKHK